MTQIRPIGTDAYGARVITELIRGAGTDTPSVGGRQPVQSNLGAVIVQLIDDIADTDYQQHDAKLLKLTAGVWVSTGQTVKVRKTGSGALTADMRLMARPVSNYGLCVDSSGISATGGGGCPCICVDFGNITVGSVECTSLRSVTLPQIAERQTNGQIILPASTYTMTYDAGLGYWFLDIGSYLISVYNNGTSATAATTMDGTLKFWKSTSSKTLLELCFTGTVPAYSGP